MSNKKRTLLDEKNGNETEPQGKKSVDCTKHKCKKQKRFNKDDFVSGRWTSEEQEIFVEALSIYGREWKKMSKMIPTRTIVQIRTHAQKYFIKQSKIKSENFVYPCKSKITNNNFSINHIKLDSKISDINEKYDIGSPKCKDECKLDHHYNGCNKKSPRTPFPKIPISACVFSKFSNNEESVNNIPRENNVTKNYICDDLKFLIEIESNDKIFSDDEKNIDDLILDDSDEIFHSEEKEGSVEGAVFDSLIPLSKMSDNGSDDDLYNKDDNYDVHLKNFNIIPVQEIYQLDPSYSEISNDLTEMETLDNSKLNSILSEWIMPTSSLITASSATTILPSSSEIDVILEPLDPSF